LWLVCATIPEARPPVYRIQYVDVNDTQAVVYFFTQLLQRLCILHKLRQRSLNMAQRWRPANIASVAANASALRISTLSIAVLLSSNFGAQARPGVCRVLDKRSLNHVVLSCVGRKVSFVSETGLDELVTGKPWLRRSSAARSSQLNKMKWRFAASSRRRKPLFRKHSP
jgi:hypothetical protein